MARRPRLTTLLLGALLLITSTACSRCPAPTPAPPHIAQTCGFTLTQKERDTRHQGGDENWTELKDDISKAQTYVDNYWRNHWNQCFSNLAYVAPKVQLGYYTDDQPARCGKKTVSSDNAFYCSDGHFIAFGRDLMRRGLTEGDAWVYLVVAHEWGHAVQHLLENGGYYNYVAQHRELQADCFAGAALWGSDYEGALEWQLGDSTEAAQGLLDVADETPWTEKAPTGPSAHGDAVERIGAFAQGRATNGIQTCFNIP